MTRWVIFMHLRKDLLSSVPHSRIRGLSISFSPLFISILFFYLDKINMVKVSVLDQNKVWIEFFKFISVLFRFYLKKFKRSLYPSFILMLSKLFNKDFFGKRTWTGPAIFIASHREYFVNNSLFFSKRLGSLEIFFVLGLKNVHL